MNRLVKELIAGDFKYSNEINKLQKEDFIKLFQIAYPKEASEAEGFWENFNELHFTEKLMFFVDKELLYMTFLGFIYGCEKTAEECY